jgi:Leucine-rich repeat
LRDLEKLLEFITHF